MALTSLSRIVAHWAERKPQDAALVYEGQSLTWLELERTSNRLARAYAQLGVGQDHFVTVALPNGFEFIQSCFAIWKLGATPQPVSAKAPKVERDGVIALAQPKLVVGAASGDHPGYATIPTGFTPDPSLDDTPLPERTAASYKAMTSGGSTGLPKLIVSGSPAAQDIEWDALYMPLDGSTLMTGPLYHNGPFLWSMQALVRGNRLTLMPRFDAEQTLRLIEEQAVNVIYVVPTMMQRIWNLPEETRTRYDLSSLTALWHVAAPCPGWLKEAFIDWLGADVIWETYGGTEGQGSTRINGTEWLTHRGSVGKAAANCKMKIVDPNGDQLPPGEVGEVYMLPDTGAGSTYHYLGSEAKAIDEGWESLGDMGYMDAEGYLYLSDRLTDMILSGGANIYPAEVEAAIDRFPGVRSSAAIGLPDPDLGNRVHAIVDAPAGDVTEEALLVFLAEQLVRYKIPRTIEFTREPLRDDAGKVRRPALRSARL